MMQCIPRVFIKELSDKNGIIDERATREANILNSTIQTAFTRIGCFINELIQNTDDQATQLEAEISFILKKNELIVFHNGKPFTQDDVKKICDYANSNENQKSQEDDKTGYKDVGFKSVFKAARRVDIWSGEWHFNFNEKNEGYKNPYPWQITPFWTEESELSSNAKEYVKVQDRTTFILQLREEAVKDVKVELHQFSKNPENILFLNKISKVFLDVENNHFCIVNKGNNLTVNDKLSAEWLRLDQQVLIPPEIKAFLKKLTPNECPKRLQKDELKEVTLSFCYRKKDKQLISNSESKLFCTLSTQVRAGFPFLINAPFLLDLSRSSVLENQWNIFLIDSIAKYNFEHFKSWLLKRDNSSFQILAPADMLGVERKLRKTFKERMEKNIQEEAFFPSQTAANPLLLSQSIVDPTGFYRMIHQNKLMLFDTDKFIHPDIEPGKVLQRFPHVKKITVEDLFGRLPDLMKNKEPKTCTHILIFFSKIFRAGKKYDPCHLELFKKQLFILSSSKELVSLEKVMLPPLKPNTQGPLRSSNSEQSSKSLNQLSIPECLPIHLIHPEVLTEELITWLKTINVQSLTGRIIVDIFANDLRHRLLRVKENNFAILRFIFYFYKNSLISKSDLNSLKGILIFSLDNKEMASHQAYFPNGYQPKFKLQDYLPLSSNLFLSEEYIDKNEDIKTVKSFFLNLGVAETCQFIFSKEKMLVKESLKLPQGFVKEYITHIFNGKNKPGSSDRTFKEEDSISSFAYFPYMIRMKESPTFLKFFWEQFALNQEKILNNAKITYNAYKAHTNKTTEHLSYFQYVFQNQKLISDEKGTFFFSTDLYAPSIKPFMGLNFPIAHLPVKLSEKMEKFLGLITTIKVDDCYQILTLLEKQKPCDHEIYKMVMSHLLTNINNVPLQNDILKKPWKFQAVNNEWYPVHQLKLWAVPHSFPPLDSSDWIKPIFATIEEMEKFCTFFNLQKITQFDNPHLFENTQSDDELKQFVWQKIPEIAFHWGRYRNFDKPVSFYIESLISKIEKINFFLVSEEENQSGESLNLQTTMIENNLYCLSDWEEDKDLLGELLGKYLEFDRHETSTLKAALKWKKPYRGKSQEKVSEFKKEFESKIKSIDKEEIPDNSQTLSPLQSKPFLFLRPPEVSFGNDESESSMDDKEEVPDISQTWPLPQLGSLLFPSSPKNDGSESETENNMTPKKVHAKKPWNPTTLPSEDNDSPITDVSSKKNKEPKFPFASPRKRQKTGGKKECNDDDQGLNRSDLENKRIGLWAEEHALTKRMKEYMKKHKEDDPKGEDLRNGIRRVTLSKKNTVIDFHWYNDPILRPKGKENDELWDSGQHFDIVETKWVDGNVKRVKKLEVKGTPGSQVHFILKGQEWKTLLEDPSNYHIYVVTEVGKSSAEVKRYKSLMDALSKRLLTPISSAEFRET